MAIIHRAMLVVTREEVPDPVVRWACTLLDEEVYFSRYTHSEDTGFLIFDIASLLAVAREARTDPSIPPPPRGVLSWLRRQYATARREKAARLIWVG